MDTLFLGADRPADRQESPPHATFWRKAKASRLKVLVDGDAYFRAFQAAALNARHQIMILGWDLDSRLELCRSGTDCPNAPDRLGDLLDFVVDRTPGLTVHILLWDFTMLFALDRQPLPVYHFAWRRRRRVRFALDNRHPFRASHHQKIVVFDDELAMSGGMDLSARRWDTPEHLPCDERRSDSGSGPFRPIHDVQIMVEGEAAKALADLARMRFERAGLAPPPPRKPGPGRASLWPEHIEPDLSDVEVRLARTMPAHAGHAEAREIEASYLSAIGSARDYILIENQYLTSRAVTQALKDRLAEDAGPEILILLPFGNAGWLEESTMGVVRARILRELKAADKNGRLGVWSPLVRQDGSTVYVKVHAKVLIVDDEILTVGSANLSNRSMGLDTECDVTLLAQGEGATRTSEFIRRLKNRLLAEHLGHDEARVQSVLDQEGSILAGVRLLAQDGAVPGKSRPHMLMRPTEASVDPIYEDFFPGQDLVDPERPADPEQLLRVILESGEVPRKRPVLIVMGLATALAAIIALWELTPIHQILDPPVIAGYWLDIERQGLSWIIIQAAFLVGGQIAFPITVLIAATAIAFPPLEALAHSLFGSLAAALIGYGLGRVLGRDLIARIGGRRINNVSRRLGRKGVTAVAMLRVLPVAPFTLVNVVCGASKIGLRDYLLGNLIGMTPGIVVFTLLGETVLEAFVSPSPSNIAILLLALVLPLLLAWGVQRLLDRGHDRNLPTA